MYLYFHFIRVYTSTPYIITVCFYSASPLHFNPSKLESVQHSAHTKFNLPLPPNWGPFYTTSGEIQLPYAELVEPFSVWYDARTFKSRIEYYDGTTRTYMRGDQGKYGTSYMVNPITDDTKHVFNQVTCLEVHILSCDQ